MQTNQSVSAEEVAEHTKGVEEGNRAQHEDPSHPEADQLLPCLRAIVTRLTASTNDEELKDEIRENLGLHTNAAYSILDQSRIENPYSLNVDQKLAVYRLHASVTKFAANVNDEDAEEEVEKNMELCVAALDAENKQSQTDEQNDTDVFVNEVKGDDKEVTAGEIHIV